MSSFIFLFLLTFLTSMRPSIQQPKLEYVGYVCPLRHTYLKNSTYSSNLKTLLFCLTSKDNNYFFSTGFQSLSMGQNPDMVFGLYLCRGDLSPEVCRDCVNIAVNDTLNQCPNGKEALIYYDNCMLRYADRNILLDPITKTGQLMVKQENIAANQLDRFSKVVLSLMNEAAEEAASSPRKFAFKKANFSSSQTAYVLVQCTPDLTRENCSNCLQKTIHQLPREKIGGRLLWPSCTARYEINRFYNETLNTTPQPRGKGRKPTVIIIVIVVLLAVSALLFIACYCFRVKRAHKTYETAAAGDGK